MAVIHSKLARSTQLGSSPSNVSGLPVPPIPLPGQVQVSDVDALSKLLEKAGRANSDQPGSVSTNTQLQSQAQPLSQRQPRANRQKRTQRSQIPDQAVEMPGSMTDSLDVQFGNLEFVGDSVTSPKKQQVGCSISSIYVFFGQDFYSAKEIQAGFNRISARLNKNQFYPCLNFL